MREYSRIVLFRNYHLGHTLYMRGFLQFLGYFFGSGLYDKLGIAPKSRSIRYSKVLEQISRKQLLSCILSSIEAYKIILKLRRYTYYIGCLQLSSHRIDFFLPIDIHIPLTYLEGISRYGHSSFYIVRFFIYRLICVITRRISEETHRISRPVEYYYIITLDLLQSRQAQVR